ncbi:MAG: type I-U CRISPR-associated protein Csx17 [Candidatus Tectimicrobiota bacterium]
MSRELCSVRFAGIRPDSLGNYLVGLGLLSALARNGPSLRAGWRNGCFIAVGEMLTHEQIEQYLLERWTPLSYERWWVEGQKADTKAKSDQTLWKARSVEAVSKVRLLDSHIVGVGRNQFNPLMGTGGNIGKRNLAKAFVDATTLLAKSDRLRAASWLRGTLYAQFDDPMPELNNAGTWFVYANKTFNSGQSWYREGQISPWSFLLALEGSLLFVGGVARRLNANARSYAVFPFISEGASPISESEVGLARAEFWAPLWQHPATLSEVRALLERGLARIGQRAAKAPHEFAIAARAAGVDAGVTEFVRFTLRQTTSSQVYEAIPREKIQVSASHSLESQLLEPLLHDWFDRLPFDKQKGQFIGLRGPVEDAIIRVAERPDDTEQWQRLLLVLADVQGRIDHNKEFRKRCRALPLLDPGWFDKAWPVPPDEMYIACAIASISAGTPASLLGNIYGVEIDKSGRPGFAGEQRPQRVVWHNGEIVRLLGDILERRLVDTDSTAIVPLAAHRFCTTDQLRAFLDGSLDFDEIRRWIPPLALIDWSKRQPLRLQGQARALYTRSDGMYLLHALFRPFFYPGTLRLDENPLFPNHLRPRSAVTRRLLNLIRQGEGEEAVHLARSRYLAAGHTTIVPPCLPSVDYERLTASLLIPLRQSAVVTGLSRWLQPSKNKLGGERL